MMQRILLIDDEKDFTELAGTLLRFHDMEVDTVNDPKNVEEAITKTRYELIVTDLMMPGLDGFELIRRVRAMTDYARVPIIVLSAKVLTDAERKFLLQNKTSFLMKPFDPQGLVEHISKTLSETKTVG